MLRISKSKVEEKNKDFLFQDKEFLTGEPRLVVVGCSWPALRGWMLLEGLCFWLCHQMLLLLLWPCFRPKWAIDEWPLGHRSTVLKGNVIVPTLRMRNLKARILSCLINTLPPPTSSAELPPALPGCLLMGAFPSYSDRVCVLSVPPHPPRPKNLPLLSPEIPELGRSVSGSGTTT